MMGIATAITGNCQGQWIDGSPIGLPTGGTIRIAGPSVVRRGSGGLSSVRGAMFTPGGSISFIPTAESTFLSTPGIITRAVSGYPCSALTDFTFTYSGESDYDFNNCKVNTLELSCSQTEPLAATMDFSALSVEAGSAGSGAITDGWEWYDGTVTFEGGSYSLQGFTINLDNSNTPITDIDAPNATMARFPKRIIEGDEMVRMTLRTQNEISPATLGSWNAEPTTTLTLNAALTNSSAGTCTIAVDGTIIDGAELPVESEAGVVIYSYSFVCAPNTSALTIALS